VISEPKRAQSDAFAAAGDHDAALVEAQRFEAVIKARYGINHRNYETGRLRALERAGEPRGMYRRADQRL
jgi:hypothetical protein